MTIRMTLVMMIGLLSAAFSQTTTSIHLFQNYFWDADVTDTAYDEAFVDLRSYDFGSTNSFGIKGGFALTPQFEMNGQLALVSRSVKNVDSNFGLSDLLVSVRFLPYQQNGTTLAVGAQLILPLGDEDVGYGRGGFGMFGALRRKVSEKALLAASMGVDIVPEVVGVDENVAALKIGGGWIQSLDQRTHIIAEAVLISRVDYLVISGGLDHLLANNAHLRVVLGLGMDKESPKVFMSAGYTFSF